MGHCPHAHRCFIDCVMKGWDDMEERKEKRHLQGMRNVLLAFAFCFVCALFVGVSPVYAAKQECGYKITEADQDFIVWAKDNLSLIHI